LAAELKTLPNSLLIEGHTDATPYSNDASYSNWDLSADRANSARRLLQQDGVRADQVTQVRGYADQMLRVKNNPTDPSNRRISILVKNDNESQSDSFRCQGGGWNDAVPGAVKAANPRKTARAGRKTASRPPATAPKPSAPLQLKPVQASRFRSAGTPGQAQPDGQAQGHAAGAARK
jgi:chemotaxis protein MotB